MRFFFMFTIGGRKKWNFFSTQNSYSIIKNAKNLKLKGKDANLSKAAT